MKLDKENGDRTSRIPAFLFHPFDPDDTENEAGEPGYRQDDFQPQQRKCDRKSQA